MYIGLFAILHGFLGSSSLSLSFSFSTSSLSSAFIRRCLSSIINEQYEYDDNDDGAITQAGKMHITIYIKYII